MAGETKFETRYNTESVVYLPVVIAFDMSPSRRNFKINMLDDVLVASWEDSVFGLVYIYEFPRRFSRRFILDGEDNAEFTYDLYIQGVEYPVEQPSAT